MNKKIWVAAIVALLFLLPAAALIWLQGSIRGLIERQGRVAFGVETEVADADLSLFSGRLDLTGVRIANPEGFKTPEFVKLGRVRVQFQPTSLASQTVRISQIDIDDVQVRLENQRGKFNYRPILDHLNRSSGEAGETGEDRPSRRLAIDKLQLRGVEGRLELGLGGASLGATTIRIPDQSFENLGADGSIGMRELMGRIVEALMRGVAVQGKGEINRELLGDLWGRLAGEPPDTKDPARKPPIEDVVKDLQDLLRKP